MEFIPNALRKYDVFVSEDFQDHSLLKSYVTGWAEGKFPPIADDKELSPSIQELTEWSNVRRNAFDKFASKIPSQKSVLSLFNKAEKSEIVAIVSERTLPRLIHEYCRIYLSRGEAWKRLIMRATGFTEDQAAKNPIDAQDLLLNELQKSGRKLSSRGFPEVIFRSALANDESFFVQLGSALKKRKRKPKPDVDWDRANDQVRLFLCANWFDNRNPIPDLCHFTYLAIANLCQIAFPTLEFAEDTIRKTVKRLALKKARTATITDSYTNGDRLHFR